MTTLIASVSVSPYLFIFGPTPFVDSLVTLSETEKLIYKIGVELDDDDPTLYKKLLSQLEEEVGSNKNACVLIFCPLLGDRFCTIGLSIPKFRIHVIPGVNVELLFSLRSETQLSTIAEQREARDSTSTDSSTSEDSQHSLVDESFEIEELAERITAQARRGVILLNSYLRDESEESNIDASILETDISSLM